MSLKDFDRERVEEKIVSFIKRVYEEVGCDKLIIGLSGGLDSSLTASFCQKAVGSNNVLGVYLPVEKSISLPKKIADHLEIDFEEIDVGNCFLNIINLLETECSHFSDDKIALGNLKARLRMIILYYHSNSLDGLVAGTGNKSEIKIGYFTKFGDGAADFFPIGDLYKTQVKEMAKFVGLPNEVIRKTPSAGLWNDQTDEDEIGYNYKTLDKVLFGLENSKEEKVREDFGEEVVDDIKDMIRSSEHKREKAKSVEIF